MRLSLIALSLLTGVAEARSCKLPELAGRDIRGLRSFSECLVDEIADLKRQQAEFIKEINDLRILLANIPGEIENRNGRVTHLGGERLAQATYLLAARSRESAVALDIDQQVLVTLCELGCSITLSISAEGLREADPAPVAALGPCAFRYNRKSGAWALSGACGDPVSGIDGDGVPNGTPGGEAIVALDGACSLADSEPGLSVDADVSSLGSDRAMGLFLLAEPALWLGAETRFRCELKITR
jgi:hypothetical protein